MNSAIIQRLEELKNEYKLGQETINELKQRESDLSQTLLRISGAIQVLTELLESEQGDTTGQMDVKLKSKTEAA